MLKPGDSPQKSASLCNPFLRQKSTALVIPVQGQESGQGSRIATLVLSVPVLLGISRPGNLEHESVWGAGALEEQGTWLGRLGRGRSAPPSSWSFSPCLNLRLHCGPG